MCVGELGGHINCAAILLWHIGIPLGVLCLCGICVRAIRLWQIGAPLCRGQCHTMGAKLECHKQLISNGLEVIIGALYWRQIARVNWMLGYSLCLGASSGGGIRCWPNSGA